MNSLLRILRCLFNCEKFLAELLSEVKSLRIGQQRLELCFASVSDREKADRLLTAQEAADLLKISARTLKNWQRSGKLTPTLVGNHPYYKVSYLLNL